MNSPYDDVDAATKYSSTSKFLEEAGFGLINKKACTWDTEENALASHIRGVNMKGAPLTIWIEAHGALGWFFGATKDVEDEFLATVRFSAFIQKVAAFAKASIGTVVLNGCFTANELLNTGTNNFNLSPARMLSFISPGIQVVGFIGKNASAKVTSVFDLDSKKRTFTSLSLNPEEASVLYVSGKVIEGNRSGLYCNHRYTHGFMADLLELDETDVNNEEAYYQPLDVVGHMAAKKITGTGYGAQQLAWLVTPPLAFAEVTDDEEEVDEENVAEASALVASM